MNLGRGKNRQTSRRDSEGLLYHEVQHFRQLWLWILILGISLVAIWSLIQQIFLDTPFGNNPAPDAVLIIIVIVFGFLFPATFYKMNLTTEVCGDGIYYRFFPFHLSFHKIKLEDIVECQVRSYSTLKDYGGWGIRYGRMGKAYNVSGDRGVQLKLSKGSRLLFGSQKPEEFAAAIELALSIA
jgi:hypothetical protein